MTIADNKIVEYYHPDQKDNPTGSGPYSAFKKTWEPKGFVLTDKFKAQEAETPADPAAPAAVADPNAPAAVADAPARPGRPAPQG